MSTISKERRDEIRAYIVKLRTTGRKVAAVFGQDDILALLDALDAAEMAEPALWITPGNLNAVKEQDGQPTGVVVSMAADDDGTRIPLYTHPAPAVREGWKPLTENVVGPVLVCRFGDEDHNWLPLTAYRVTGGKWERPASRDGLPYEPTHWQRLPTAAPEAK